MESKSVMATAISAHLLQFYSTQKPKVKSYSDRLSQARLRQVTEYINEHSAENPSLITMAEIVQISPYYFSRLFKKSTGLTPHQYLLKCRTEQAKRLLKSSKKIIKVFKSIYCNYCCSSRFCRSKPPCPPL